ncbi:RNA 2'-phosphotransferase [Aliiroseovarius sp. 2305UL8-7]|uniref:RNA 2'-phosphotransferase n=1 Tax=Aliiroseovarius conchicola TaxID=3121637 RepID=UPI0035278614
MSKESKFLSRILRHEPELVGLSLGLGGWVLVDDLLRGIKRTGRTLKREELDRIVAESDKRRFTLSEDGRRIRAAQGHSVDIDLELPEAVPPKMLYHGTASANLDAIWAEGLLPGRRRHVHLSPDVETAIKVGTRHGRPVVLTVATGRMQSDGKAFWQADNGVWLTNAVAPEYLGFA